MQTKTTVPFELTGKRIFVAGHRGMAGSAIVRRLQQEPCEVLTAPRSELDLTRQDKVESYLSAQKPDVVIVAAGRVGGIIANDCFPVNSSQRISPSRSTVSRPATRPACRSCSISHRTA